MGDNQEINLTIVAKANLDVEDCLEYAVSDITGSYPILRKYDLSPRLSDDRSIVIMILPRWVIRHISRLSEDALESGDLDMVSKCAEVFTSNDALHSCLGALCLAREKENVE